MFTLAQYTIPNLQRILMKKSFTFAILLVCIVLLLTFSISPCHANLSNGHNQYHDETRDTASSREQLSNLSLHRRRIRGAYTDDMNQSGDYPTQPAPADGNQSQDDNGDAYGVNDPTLREGDLLHRHKHIQLPPADDPFVLPSNAGDNFKHTNINAPSHPRSSHHESRSSLIQRMRQGQAVPPQDHDVDLLSKKPGVKTTTFMYDIIDSQYDDTPWYDQYIGPRDNNPDLTKPRTSKKYAWGGRKRVHRKIS